MISFQHLAKSFGPKKVIEDVSFDVRDGEVFFIIGQSGVGKSVLITDHNVAQTLKVCDRALIINDGRVIMEGTPKQIINDPGVRSAYLGSTFKGDEFD